MTEWCSCNKLREAEEKAAKWDALVQTTHSCPCGAQRTCELIKHAALDEESGIELVLYECGQCGWIVDPSRNERYCPNCGARVKED